MVGSAGNEKIALSAANASYTLYGPLAGDLLGWVGRVCVRYDPTAPGLPGHGIRIISYRLQGDGKRAPIVGTIARRNGQEFEVRTGDGKRFTIHGTSAQLDPFVGRRIWLIARWTGGALKPLQLGLLGAQR